MPGMLIDNRSDPTPPTRLYFGKKRKPADIQGVMLHMTACRLGEKPERWKQINAHIGVTREGKVILMHDFLMELWHGNKPSPWTIGIEFDGNMAGYSSGKYWKPGGGPDRLTAAQQASANEILLPFLQNWFQENESSWLYTLAHRQSSGDREYDPGFMVWNLVALPWMRATGSTDGDLLWGKGALVPKDWDVRKLF